MKICLIGNSGILSQDKGGQTTKLRLYMKKIEDEGFELFFVDLERFFHHPFSIFRKIKKGIKECNRIVLLSGERACKLLIPYINRINKKYHKTFVLPVVGSGLLHYSIDHLSNEDVYKFFVKKDFSKAKTNNKIQKQLSLIDYILPETTLLHDVYKQFYGLKNCYVFNNFREFNSSSEFKNDNNFRMIYLSRVMEIKGIFDLLNVFSKIKNDNVVLDIYGSIELNKEEKELFFSKVKDNINYCGVIDNDNVVNLLTKYDLFIFPTRAAYEGTPGVIAESLIAGTPILTSNFPNASSLLIDGYDSVFYEMFNMDDLKEKLEWCINNKDKIREMRNNCLESSKKFTYEYNRKDFLKYVCGVENE